MGIFSLFTKLRYLTFGKSISTDLKCYSGTYAGGKARYHYYECNGERIYHGRMSFSLIYPDHPYGNGLKSAEGTFADGMKCGRWKFVNHKHDESSELSINYVEGVADGECVFKINRRDPLVSNRGKNILKITMCGGKPVGIFRGQFPHSVLTGYFDDKGRPDGLWTLDFTVKGSCVVNYEEWNHGVCVDAYEFDNSTGRRHKPKVQITEFLSNFIHRNWLSLTKILPKGSVDWNGQFNV